MNINLYITTDYENKHDWTLGENEPKTNPIYRGDLSAEASAKAEASGEAGSPKQAGEAGSNSKLSAVTKILKISWTILTKPAKITFLRFKLESEVNSYGT
jgi:hypothetical protein